MKITKSAGLFLLAPWILLFCAPGVLNADGRDPEPDKSWLGTNGAALSASEVRLVELAATGMASGTPKSLSYADQVYRSMRRQLSRRRNIEAQRGAIIAACARALMRSRSERVTHCGGDIFRIEKNVKGLMSVDDAMPPGLDVNTMIHHFSRIQVSVSRACLDGWGLNHEDYENALSGLIASLAGKHE